MPRKAFTSDKLPPPAGPFSQAIDGGALLFLSGQVGQDPATGKLVSGGVAAETEQLLDNIATVLAAAGKTMDDVVRAGVFLADMADFAVMNAVYERRFATPYPARTCVQAAALPLGARVEIDVVAR
jgi:2-iminobutanoate/2-iminopropanoate deaminase